MLGKCKMGLDSFLPKTLPAHYQWVLGHAAKQGPNIMREALKTHGLHETRGEKHTPEIIEMAERLGGAIKDFYTADEIPWCGLAVSYWIKQAGFEPLSGYSQIRARDFADWGNPAYKPSFGDVLTFWRGAQGGRDGHVGLYVCEDADAFHVIGGNQNNQVNITRIAKNRLIAARRCPWKIKQPTGVKPFYTKNKSGPLLQNEA